MTAGARGRLAGAAAAVALLGAAVAFDVPLCPLATLAGIPCPGCGLTRATVALLTGDVGEALRLHPLSPVALPLVAWGLWITARQTHPSPAVRAAGTTVATVAVLSLIGVWAARFWGFFGGPVTIARWG